MKRRGAVVGVVALAAVSTLPTSAFAGGVTINVQPRGESAKVIRDGLSLYGFLRDLRNRAKTDQKGTNNGAAIAQRGSGNTAYLFQRGRDNSGTITQTGNNNFFGLFQFGRRNSTTVVQSGNGGTGFTLQGNW